MLKIKALVISLALSCSAAHAYEMNAEPRLAALVHTERAKRNKKCFGFMPGKIIAWHYEYVMPDGTVRIKIEDKEIKGVYDRRPLRESHPNWAIALPVIQAAGAMGSPMIARAI